MLKLREHEPVKSFLHTPLVPECIIAHLQAAASLTVHVLRAVFKDAETNMNLNQAH